MPLNRRREDKEESDHAGLTTHQQDPLVKELHRVIGYAVRLLSVLMTLVILWGLVDVVYVLYQRLVQPPFLMLEIQDLLATFGAFLAVLIAIEIFINITLYLRDDVIHVKLVIATALMAVARKVIVFDYQTLAPAYIWATGALLIALGITYWLVAWKSPRKVLLQHEYDDEQGGK